MAGSGGQGTEIYRFNISIDLGSTPTRKCGDSIDFNSRTGPEHLDLIEIDRLQAHWRPSFAFIPYTLPLKPSTFQRPMRDRDVRKPPAYWHVRDRSPSLHHEKDTAERWGDHKNGQEASSFARSTEVKFPDRASSTPPSPRIPNFSQDTSKTKQPLRENNR